MDEISIDLLALTEAVPQLDRFPSSRILLPLIANRIASPIRFAMSQLPSRRRRATVATAFRGERRYGRSC